MDKLSERLAELLNEYCKTLDADKLAEIMLLIPEVAQLEGAWENAGHRCPQCGTGNPKVTQLEGAMEELQKGIYDFADIPLEVKNFVYRITTKALEAGGEDNGQVE